MQKQREHLLSGVGLLSQSDSIFKVEYGTVKIKGRN